MKVYTLDDILKTEHLGDEKYVRLEEVERLKKEKEWLLNECAGQYVFEGKMKATATMEEAKKWLSDNMQQALKENKGGGEEG